MNEEVFVNIGKKNVNMYVSQTIRQLYLNLGKAIVLRAMGGESIANAIQTACILKLDKVIKSEMQIAIGIEANRRGFMIPSIKIQVNSVIGGSDFHA